MTEKEAMKLALEALEYIEHNYMSLPAPAEKAITSLREALAEQPAQQEPLGVLNVFDDAESEFGWSYDISGNFDQHKKLRQLDGAPLYTSPQPAQRTWVGLTDEQIDFLRSGYQSGRIGSFVELCRTIEAKLRSKNEDRN